jgi:hypothetical protein
METDRFFIFWTTAAYRKTYENLMIPFSTPATVVAGYYVRLSDT